MFKGLDWNAPKVLSRRLILAVNRSKQLIKIILLLDSKVISCFSAKMGLKTQLTSEERAQILLRRLNPNWPGVRIGQEIGRSTATVNRFLANPEDYGRKPRSGRPRKIPQWRLRQIRHLATRRRFSAPKIKAKLQLDCSVTTVQRNLAKNLRLKWSKMARKPPLTPDQMEARLRFAWDHA